MTLYIYIFDLFFSMSTKNCGSNRLKLKRQKIKSKGSQGFWNLHVLKYKLYLEKNPPPRKKWDKMYNLPRCSRAPNCFAELSPQKCCSVPNCFFHVVLSTVLIQVVHPLSPLPTCCVFTDLPSHRVA